MKNLPLFINILFYILLIIPGVPYQIGLIGILGSLFVTTFLSPRTGLLSLCFIISGYILVRWKSPDSLILAGFREEVIFVFLISYVFHYLFSVYKNSYGNHKIPKDNLLYIVIIWFFICLIINSDADFKIFVFAFRENLLVWLLFPVIVNLLNDDSRIIKDVFIYLCLGVGFVAFFNILNYYEFLNIPFDKYAIRELGGGRSYVHSREYLGILINRMNAFYGIGPGGGGLYYFVLGVTSFFSATFLTGKNRIIRALLFTGSGISLYCTFLTASVSSVVAIFFISAAMYIHYSKMVKYVLIFPVIIVVLVTMITTFSYLGINLAGVSYGSPVEYFFEGFLSKAFETFDNFKSADYLFGQGVALRTGSSILDDSTTGNIVSIDISWVIIAVKFGLIGFLSVIILYGKYITSYIKLNSARHNKYLLILTGILFLGSLSYVHSSPMILRPFDFISMLSFCLIYYFKNYESKYYL